VIEDVLIIGYGNALRTDDGLGWHAAGVLAADPRLAGATILRRHQLTPELALDIGSAARVIFIDASNGAPGSVTIEPIEPIAATPAAAAPGWSHHVDPSVLLARCLLDT
jgi:hydrogenase maturation protease